MKNKLLKNLISEYLSLDFLAENLTTADELRKAQVKAQALILWSILYRTYGSNKMRKKIDEFRATK
jgi:hypothetical protein